MAVLAVYILLALVGASVCEDQWDVPTPPPTCAPTATSTPPPPKSKPSAQRPPSPRSPPPDDDDDDDDDDDEPSPTSARAARWRQSLSPRRLKKLLRRGRDPPLYNYALQNNARMQGRAIIHIRNQPGRDGTSVEFCACDEKLYYDAMRYQRFGAVDRWCIEYPEDRRAMEVIDNDNDDDEEEKQEEEEEMYDEINSDGFLRPQEVTFESPSSSYADTVNSAVPIHSSPVHASYSTLRSLEIQHTQPSLSQCSPATCNPGSALSESHALSSFTSQPTVCQIGDKMLTLLTSRFPCTSGSQEEPSWCERGMDAARRLASTLSEVAMGMVVHSDDEPARVEEYDDVPVDSMEVDGGSDESDESSMNATNRLLAATLEDDSPSPESKSDMGAHSDDTEPRKRKKQKQEDTIMEQAGSCKLSATPEPQPGPSGVWCRPSPKPRTIYQRRPERNYPRCPKFAIHPEDAEREIFEAVNPSARVSQPHEDLNTELDRIFGEDSVVPSSQQQEIQYCLGELIVNRFGTKARSFYTVHVKCQRQPDICPPPTVCSAVVDPFTVAGRNKVPFQQKMFSSTGDQHDQWQPPTLALPTACFCAPPDHKPRQINVYNLPAST